MESAIIALGREPSGGLVVMPGSFIAGYRTDHIGGGPEQRTGGLLPI
jgi:hypothetical protein